VGKTHLLQAACTAADAAIYIPLALLADASPAVLDSAEEAGMVCLDQLEGVLGRPDWEEALFHLLNRAHSRGTPVAVAATRPPAECPVTLADLHSRLCGMAVYALRPPAPEELGPVLAQCALRRGLRLPEDVVGFLLRHERRELAWLLRVLDHVERATLDAQRPATLPLVKTALAAARTERADRTEESGGGTGA
jgi:DnaA family protein